IRVDDDYEVPVAGRTGEGPGDAARGGEHRRALRSDNVQPRVPVPRRAFGVGWFEQEVRAAEPLAHQVVELRPGELAVVGAEPDRGGAVPLVEVGQLGLDLGLLALVLLALLL